MAEVKHTPGPWLWQHSGDGDGRYVVWTRQPHTGELATVNCEDINGDYPAKANAQLIASAPELLEALKALDEAFCGNMEDREARMAGRRALIAARAAIAKAEGRS